MGKAPAPYYQDDYCTIYHGDCRDILPHLPKIDLVLTDPPYNAGKDYGAYKDNLPTNKYQDSMTRIVSLSRVVAKNQFWVAPRYQMQFWSSLFTDGHLITIRRGARGPFRGGWSDQFEVAWAVGKPNYCEKDLWEDIRLKGEGYFFREETYGHPGYTPYRIMARAIRLLSTASVLDPFMGSGTTLRAAKDLGRKAIGIEIEEKYCEIAAKRLSLATFIEQHPEKKPKRGFFP